MMATNGDGDRYSADAIRQQAKSLADSLRERAKAGMEEAKRMTEASEKIAGVIVQTVDEYASQSERLMAYCAETAEACRSAGGSVNEMVTAKPQYQEGRRADLPPSPPLNPTMRKLVRELAEDQRS
jgi:hypothetical protein